MWPCYCQVAVAVVQLAHENDQSLCVASFGSSVDACTALLSGADHECRPHAAEELEGSVRLIGGATDPAGAWAYGRPQFFHSGAFSTLIQRFFFPLPRSSAQVACRSLGFSSGGGIISAHGGNSATAIPDELAVPDETKFVDFVRCVGDEASVAECDVGVNPEALNSCALFGNRCDVAVVCSTPSGLPPPQLPGAVSILHQAAPRSHLQSTDETSTLM